MLSHYFMDALTVAVANRTAYERVCNKSSSEKRYCRLFSVRQLRHGFQFKDGAEMPHSRKRRAGQQFVAGSEHKGRKFTTGHADFD